MFIFIALFLTISKVCCLEQDAMDLTHEYFQRKDVKLICVLSCDSQFYNQQLARQLSMPDARVSFISLKSPLSAELLSRHLAQWLTPVGVLLDADCPGAQNVLLEASRAVMFDSAHAWMVVFDATDPKNTTDTFVESMFGNLNLSVDADLVLAVRRGGGYELSDVFSFGRLQGGELQRLPRGAWTRQSGLEVSFSGFKYYERWDFHNLTLRAISVVLGRRGPFSPSELVEQRHSEGVSPMTKVAAQLLGVLKDIHNFRFNYTIADRWVGSPEPNSTLAVTNSMFWRQQDVAITCVRIFPSWLEWMDIFFPPLTIVETKFFYLITEDGVGDFEDRFLTPLSSGVWLAAAAAAVACGVLLAAAARLEQRERPALYAIFSVLAAACQQARQLALLVLGLTSMLLYNYYTSSVVSWLLSAAAPTLASLDGLIRSDLELTFEDIGYTRGWLESQGFYYYSGYKSPKEDELRARKVQGGRRTVPLFRPVQEGLLAIRSGKYAYHTEPYTASHVIGRAFSERELCQLGALQMMPPAPVYVVGQKRSPFKQFFVWSIMRAKERGHVSAVRQRVRGSVPGCPGRSPRALQLGQAAPAFALLAIAILLSIVMLLGEVLHFRYQQRPPVWAA